MKDFDFDQGGFGMQPKFPMPDAIRLLLYKYKQTKNNEFLVPVKITLDKMQGIHDDVEGGFYRYSVNQSWSIPHYEKMLETNAGIVSNYLAAYKITKNENYKQMAIKSLDYIKNSLLNKNGGFYGSQDADEEYYQLDLEYRKKQNKPFIDKNIYIDFNSMMISTFLEASKILEDNNHKDFALKTIKFLIENSYDEKFGMYHYFYGKNKFLPGMLADNVYFIKALLDAYGATKDNYYLEFAEKLNEFVIKNFFDNEDKVFFDKIETEEDIGFLKIRDKPIIENSIASENLLRLSKIKNKNEFKRIAETALLMFSEECKNFGVNAAVYGLVVEKFFE